MAFKERINPKTKKKEYKYRYYFYKDGKKRDSDTGWFSSKKEAQLEGERLKAEKEQAETDIVIQRRNKLLKTAFDEFIEEYRAQATRETTENTCTANSIWRRANTIKAKYFPLSIQKTKTKDITASTFRDWLIVINDYDLSGAYIRSLKSTLSTFNRYLRDNSYYVDKNLDIDIDVALQKIKLKPKNYKNRELLGERRILTVSEIEMVCDYFYDKGIEVFKNFYFYTLFYVLFYSGIRVEEIIALQWKHIDLRPQKKEIQIQNAINQRELRANVYERIKRGIYSTKNRTSKRRIPIFEFYYDLLIDYKNSYKYEFNLSLEEIEECFVFPKLNRHNPHEYQDTDRLTLALKEALTNLKLQTTDCQMLRHSCATFLVLPEPEGLGFDEQKVIDYFGHTDTQMLKTIYAKINEEQKLKRMKQTFSGVYKPEIENEQTIENNTQSRLIERIKGDNEKAETKRKERICLQIDTAIKRKQEKYGYLAKDKKYIDYFLSKYPDKKNSICFVEEEQEQLKILYKAKCIVAVILHF